MNSSMFVLLAIGAAIGVLTVFVMGMRKRSREKPADAPEKPAERTGARIGETEEKLLLLNQSARLDPNLSDAHVSRIESTVDAGIGLLEALAKSDELLADAMSFEICRILGFWLPDHVRKYSALNGESRQSKSAEFLKAIDDMAAELQEFGRLIEQGLTVEYSANLTMIQIKYGKGS